MTGLGLGLGLAQCGEGSGQVAIVTNPAITGTAGGTLTITPGNTVHAVSSTYQWYRDFIPITGETGRTLDSASWPGSIRVVQTATGASGSATALSANFNNGTNATLAATETFEEATTNNQKYNTVTGRMLAMAGGNQAEQDKYLVRANGSHKVLGAFSSLLPILQSNGQSSKAVAFLDYDLTANHRIECDATAGTLSKPSYLILSYVDEFNYIYIQCASSDVSVGWQVYSFINGVSTDQTSQLNGGGTVGFHDHYLSYTSSYSVRAEISGGVLRMYSKYDGAPDYTPLQLYKSTNPLETYELDLSGVLNLPQGNKAGVLVGGGGGDAVRMYSLDAPVVISNVETSTAGNSPIVTAKLHYVGTVDPTGFDIAVMGLDGAEIYPRTPATIASLGGGSAEISFTDPSLRALEGGSGYLQVWKTGTGLSGAEGGALLFSMPIYQTVFPYRQGLNEGFTSTDVCDPFTDLLHSAGMRTGLGAFDHVSSGLSFNRHGLPTMLDPVYSAGYTFLLKKPEWSAPDRAGSYLIRYPADKTINVNSKMGTLDNIEPGLARYHRGTTATGDFPMIWFTGDSLAFRAEDVISIKKEDDLDPENLITQSASSSHAALAKTYRCMLPRMVNSPAFKLSTATQNVRFTDDDRWVGGPCTAVPMSVEQQVSGCNQASIDLYWNARHVDDEDLWRAEARYAAETLDPSLKAEVEFSNEIWNRQFRQYHDVALEGVRLGFAADTAASYAAAIAETVYFNGYSNVTSTNPNSSVAVPDNGLLFVNITGVGTIVLRAIGDQPAGTPIPLSGTSDNNWTLVYTNSQVTNARLRGQAHYSQRLFQIWDEEFAAAERERPTFMLGVQNASAVSTDTLKMFDWVTQSGDPLYQTLDRLMVAPYWSNMGGPGNIGNYLADYPAPTYPHPWTATEKGLINTDPVAFQTAFWAIANDCIDFVIDNLASLKHDLAAELVARNLSPDRIQIGSYECNWHVQFYNWPAELTDAANDMFGTLMRSPEFALATKRYLSGIASRVGGTHVVFNRIGGIPTTGSDKPSTNGAAQSWVIMENETDVATSGTGENYRYEAFADAKNGVFA